MVEGCVIVELKSVERIAREHEAQVINYLKASSVDVGLLLNFGPSAEFRRKIVEATRTPRFQTLVFLPEPS